jgi:hypothetical protein
VKPLIDLMVTTTYDYFILLVFRQHDVNKRVFVFHNVNMIKENGVVVSKARGMEVSSSLNDPGAWK